MPRRPREVPPPHPLIGFTQPAPVAGDHLIRVVVHMDTKSKNWGFFEVARAVVVADDIDDVPEVPADLEYSFNDQTEAVHAALEVRASAGNQFRIVRDRRSGRWGFHEVPRSVHLAEDAIVADDVQFPFNTVADATVGALRHLEPYWGDPSTALSIDGGVAVPGMPSNARIIGSPGYRARIDGGLYDLNQSELQAVHERTRLRSGEQAPRNRDRVRHPARPAGSRLPGILRKALAETPPETRKLSTGERLARPDDAIGEEAHTTNAISRPSQLSVPTIGQISSPWPRRKSPEWSRSCGSRRRSVHPGHDGRRSEHP